MVYFAIYALTDKKVDRKVPLVILMGRRTLELKRPFMSVRHINNMEDYRQKALKT